MIITLEETEIGDEYKKNYQTDDNSYTVISVPSTHSSHPNSETNQAERLRLYRSVIFSTKDSTVKELGRRHIHSFSPTKSVAWEDFQKKHGLTYARDKFIITEIIEGTMLNLWYDFEADKWEIATKNAVGGNYYYYKSFFKARTPTFREMFLEALLPMKIEFFNPNYIYSFVLQHPYNHLVLPVTEPAVYLVSVYERIFHEGTQVSDSIKQICQTEYQEWHSLNEYEKIRYPPILNNSTGAATSINELWDFIKNHEHTTMGVMITEKATSKRTKLENPKYAEYKELRGNHPNIKYRFYELLLKRNQNNNEDMRYFLYCFPMYQLLFDMFYLEFTAFVKETHKYYVETHIKKNRDLVVPRHYLYHINKLHYTIYLPSLFASKEIDNSFVVKQKKRTIITFPVVYEYFTSLSPSTIMLSLKYKNIWEKKARSMRQEGVPEEAQPTDDVPSEIAASTPAAEETYMGCDEDTPMEVNHRIPVESFEL